MDYHEHFCVCKPVADHPQPRARIISPYHSPPARLHDTLQRRPHSRLADLLSWKHSGFNIHDGGEKPVPAHDTEGRKRLAEYLLRHPFSLQKITWNSTTQTVIYRSKRHHTTKRNFEIFKAPDFIAAVIDHLPAKRSVTFARNLD